MLGQPDSVCLFLGCIYFRIQPTVLTVHNCIRLGKNVNSEVILLSHCSSSRGLYWIARCKNEHSFHFPFLCHTAKISAGQKAQTEVGLKNWHNRSSRKRPQKGRMRWWILLLFVQSTSSYPQIIARGKAITCSQRQRINAAVSMESYSAHLQPSTFTAIRGRARCTQLGMHVCPYHSSHRWSLLFLLSLETKVMVRQQQDTPGRQGRWKEMYYHYVLHKNRWAIFS